MRRALRTVEAMAPVVLWVDEIEKGFAASQRSGDGGTSMRVLGSFLRWLQERPDGVFLVATCNDIGALPPELLRRGPVRRDVLRRSPRGRTSELTILALQLRVRDREDPAPSTSMNRSRPRDSPGRSSRAGRGGRPLPGVRGRSRDHDPGLHRGRGLGDDAVVRSRATRSPRCAHGPMAAPFRRGPLLPVDDPDRSGGTSPRGESSGPWLPTRVPERLEREVSAAQGVRRWTSRGRGGDARTRPTWDRGGREPSRDLHTGAQLYKREGNPLPYR